MNKKLTKKELRSIFFRSFALEGCFNYERMQNMGYCFSMIPAIKKLYDTKEEQAAALQRHLELFNTTPAIVPTIMGISAAMEEENSNNPTFNQESIGAVKTSLMGPLAGVGDSIIWGTLRVIAAGIGASLAKQGSIFGPILFLLIFNIPSILIRVFGLKIGYKVGVSSLEKIQKNGMMDKIMAIATIVGLAVTGAMVATMLNVTTPLKLNIGGAKVVLQTLFDQILPKLIPLGLTFTCYKLIKKVSITKLTVGCIIFGIAMHLIGLL